MKKPRVVPFSVDGTEPPDGNYYPSNGMGVKGGAFLDTKTGRVYVITTFTSNYNFIAEKGAQAVEETILQHKEKL